MSEQNIFEGFDDFEIADRPNYRKLPVEKVKEPKPEKPYNVLVNFPKRKIRFDNNIIKEIDLAKNSLAHATSRSKGQVAIIVVPGKEGLFAKGIEGHEKGNAYKNRKLVEELVELNLTSGKYKMTLMGTAPAKIGKKTVDDCKWYSLEMIGEPQIVDLTQPDTSNEENFELVSGQNANESEI